VALSRETVLSFDEALDPDTVTSAAVHATAPGQSLPAMLKLSADGKHITLFYTELLPASAVVQVTVDGELLHGMNGFHDQADVDGDGHPGGSKTIEFSTVSVTPLAGTAICGRVFASELATDGSGLSVNVPLQGALVTVDGAEDTLFTITDANGDFRLDPCPAGKFFVHVDGSMATAPVPPPGSYYPTVGKAWDPTPGQESLVGEIFLPLVPVGTLQPVSATQDAVIGFAPSVLATYPDFASCSITVPAGALFHNDGSPGLQAGIAPVPPDRLPGPLPEQLDMGVVITVQTDGAENFDAPAPVVFPNVAPPSTGILPLPGEKLSLWSFNHDSGDWEIVGSATVSADGLTVASDPGVGIKAPGWHGLSPCPGQASAGPAGDPCDALLDNCGLPIAMAALNCALNLSGFGDAFQCGFGLGQSLVQTANCTFQLGSGTTPLQCLYGFSSGMGSAALNCLVGLTKAANPLRKISTALNCIGGFVDAGLGCAASPDCFESSSPEDAYDDQLQAALDGLAEQEDRLERLLAALVAFFGDDTWFASEPGTDDQVFTDWIVAWSGTMDPASELGATISAAETSFLLGLPYPDGIVSADVVKFVDRCNRTVDYWGQGIFTIGDVPPGSSTDFVDASVLQLACEEAGIAMQQNLAAGFGYPSDGFEYWSRKLYDTVAGSLPPFTNELYWSLENCEADPVPTQHGKSAGGVISGRCCDNGSGSSGADPVVGFDEYCFSVLDPVTLKSGSVKFLTGPIGSNVTIPRVIMLPPDGADADADGLTDDDEAIVGTIPSVFDTDADGIGDGAELQNGTNPLDGLAAATGIIAIVDTPGTARDIEALNDVAIVADGDGGVQVYNVFNGMDPLLIASVPTPGPALDVAIDGKLIAVAMGSSGLAIIDVSDPITASIVSTVSASALGGPANRVVATAGVAFVAGPPGRIAAVSVELGQAFDFAFVGATVLDLALEGDVLWAVTNNSLVSVALLDGLLDVSGSVALGPVSLSADSPRLFVGGGVATVTHGKGYNTFNIADPGQPQLVASWFVLLQAWRDYAADGSGLAVACVGPSMDATDLLVLEAQDPSQLGAEVGLYETPGPARDVAIYNGFAYVADDASGLETINYQSFDALGVPPTASFTADVDGPDVQEQQLVLLRAAVSDDVVVRNVEFWAEGERLVTDGNFPFEAFVHVHDLDGDDLFSVFVIARDTGGNSTTSTSQSWMVVPDTHGPQVIQAIPAQSSSVFAFYLAQQGATFVFDEPIDTDTDAISAVSVVSAGDDDLFGSSDDVAVAHTASLVSLGQRLVVMVPSPPDGLMRFRLDDLYLLDLAGNFLDGDGNGSPGADFVLDVTVISSPSKAWDSPNSGAWTGGRNWTGDVVPVGTDVVDIDVPTAVTVNLPSSNATFLNLTCKEGFLLNGGTLTPGVEATFLGDYAQVAGTLQGVAPTFLAGTGTWTGGVMTQLGPTVVSGSFTIDGGADKSLVGGRGLDVTGMLTLGSSFSSFTLGGGGHIDVLPGGVLDARANGQLSWDSNPVSVISNSGTLRRSTSTGTFTFVAPVISNGIVEVTSGALDLWGACLGGDAQMDAGTELRFVTASHLLTGFSSSGAGSLRLNNTLVDGDVTVQKSYLTNGVGLAGPGTVMVTDSLAFHGGDISATGKVRIEPGAQMLVDDTTADKAVFGQIENAGTMTFGNALSFYNNALLTNLPGGVFVLDTNNTVGPNGGSPTSVNQGLMHKTAGTGLQTWSLPLASTGTIHMSIGTLWLSNPTLGGSVLLDAGTELQVGTGSFSAGLTATGAGVLRLDGAVVNGDVFVDNSRITGGAGVLGTGSVHVVDSLSFQGGALGASATLHIEPGGQLAVVDSTADKSVFGKIENAGTMTFGNALSFYGSALLTNLPGGVFVLDTNNSVGPNGGSPTSVNQGLMHKTAGTGTQIWSLPLTTSGVVRVDSGLLLLGAPVTVTGGSLELAGGNLQIGANLAIPAAATVTGSGTITTALLSTAGITAPGLAGPGTLSTSGAYTQTAPGTLQIQLGGTVAGSGYDRLNVGGTATLGGTLVVTTVSGFDPSLGNSFTVLTFAARVGDFATYSGLTLGGGKKLAPIFDGTSLTLTVVPDP